MPTLPGLTITDQATWDRVYAAFGGDPAAYKQWLKRELLTRVRQYEGQVAAEKAQTDLGANIDNAT